MATEYRDGTFSEIQPLSEAMQTFVEACDNGSAKALHVGSESEIADRMKAADMEKRLDALTEAVADLKSKDKDSFLVKPTVEQLRAILGKGADNEM